MLTVLLLFTEHWFLFLFNVPVDLWFLYRYMRKQPGQLGIFDPLEINNRRNIKTNMRVRRTDRTISIQIRFFCLGFSHPFAHLSDLFLRLPFSVSRLGRPSFVNVAFPFQIDPVVDLSLIHISEPTRRS